MRAERNVMRAAFDIWRNYFEKWKEVVTRAASCELQLRNAKENKRERRLRDMILRDGEIGQLTRQGDRQR